MRLVQWCGVPQQWYQSMWSLWCASEWEREGPVLRFGAMDLDRRHVIYQKDHCELGSNLKPTMTVLKVQVVWRFASSFWYLWRVHWFTSRGHFSIIKKMYSLVKTMISQGGIQYVSFVECNRLLPLRVVHLIWFICHSGKVVAEIAKTTQLWNLMCPPCIFSRFWWRLLLPELTRTMPMGEKRWFDVNNQKKGRYFEHLNGI